MKYHTKITLLIVFVIWLLIFLYVDYNNTYNNTIALNSQRNVIVSLSSRVDLIESNHVALVESIARWSLENERFNDELINRVKKADDTLDKKIESIAKFDAVVVEQLKATSEAQSKLIKMLVGLSTTNSVDIPR